MLPSGWLVVELVRSWQGLGGPWGLLGSSQWQVQPALRLASVGGVWLLSFLVVAVNVAVAVLVAVRESRVPAVAGLVATAAATSAAWVWAPRPDVDGRVRIAVVQPGVIDGAGSADRRFAREEQLTRRLAGQDVDLVVWGESSVGFDLGDRPDLARRIAALSRRRGADILVNVDARRSDRPGIYKSSVLVGPDGPTGDRYDKMRLVPFGEYVPARSLLGWATSVGKAAGEDRRRGTEQVVMDVRARAAGRPAGLLRVGVPRHEPPSRARTAPQRARRPVVDLVVPAQLGPRAARLARRAARRRDRPPDGARHADRRLARCTAPSGRARRARGSARTRARAPVYDVPLATGTTPYVRFGDWPVHAALPVLAVVVRGARACGRSGSGGLLLNRAYHPLAQLVSRQRVPGAEHLARAHGVEEGEHGLLDAALAGHRHPVAAPPHGRLALVVDRPRRG